MGINSRVEGFLETTEEEFTDDVLNSPHPVLVVFYRNGCSACTEWEPTLKTLAQEYGHIAKMVRMHVDIATEHTPEHPLREKYGIKGDPTTVVFFQGQPIGSILGNMRYDFYLNELLTIFKANPGAVALGIPARFKPRTPQ